MQRLHAETEVGSVVVDGIRDSRALKLNMKPYDDVKILKWM